MHQVNNYNAMRGEFVSREVSNQTGIRNLTGSGPCKL